MSSNFEDTKDETCKVIYAATAVVGHDKLLFKTFLLPAGLER